MAFDAAQILRQTYAAGADAMQMREMAEAQRPAPAEVQRGELMGTAVVVESDPMSELMDSMEELSFQFEEKAAKKTAERKMGAMQGSRSAFVRALEAWNAMMPDMPSQERMAKLLQNCRQMLSGGVRQSVDGLLKELARESTDPSHQFAMLDLMEQMLGEGETELRDLVRQARTQLMSEKGAEIKAGINLAEEVNARATSPEEMQGLRDLYRSEVVGSPSPRTASGRSLPRAAQAASPMPYRSSSLAAARTSPRRRRRWRRRRSGAYSRISSACRCCRR